MMTAAHAEARGCTVVTNNEKEFRRVRNLQVENRGGIRIHCLIRREDGMIESTKIVLRDQYMARQDDS